MSSIDTSTSRGTPIGERTTEAVPDDLVLCHQEPIRVPGSVQPHGVLLVLGNGAREDELVVRRSSASVEPLLGIAPERTIGRPLGTPFGDAVADAVASAARVLDAAGADENRVHVFELEFDVRGERLRADATLHRAGAERVLEIDGLRPVETPTETVTIGTLQRLTRRLHAARDVGMLCDRIAAEVRALVGFDRVMVYRFHPDGHGEVIAESVVPALEPFLGLHYPESDIPEQARELYRKSWIRCIPAVPYTPSAILPADAPPIDLTFSHLRSVSPIHVEYLTNMGVGASMSISLLAGERLWGLVACHHREARRVGAATRAACELLGTTFSLLLPSLEATAEARTDTTLRDVERRLLSQMANAEPFADGVFGDPPDVDLAALLDADGFASIAGDATRSRGATPDAEQIAAFAVWFGREATEDVLASEAIAERFAPATDWPHALVGVLVIEISRARGQYLMAFRRERTRLVRWAGRPDEKHVVPAEGGGHRLAPRHSFASWKESVRGRSTPWRDVERHCARTLRRAALDLVVASTEQVLRLNRELELGHEGLQTFAHIAAHDLREPLRGIANYAVFLREDHGDALDADGRRMIDTIARLADRGSSLTTALLAFAEIGGAARCRERFALERVVESVRETFAPELERRGVAFRVIGPLPELVGDVHLVEQILMNLVGNAIKYNDADEPWIEIATEPHASRSDDWIGGEHLDRRSHVVRVSDNGIGIPPVQRENVFRLFKRLHPRDAYGGGNGVGLAIVRRAVEMQGGRIAVSSTPGAGTTFRFSYGEPADRPPDGVAAPASDARGARTRRSP